MNKKNSSNNIYINARFLSQPITGVQRYAIELVKGLDALLDRAEIDGREYSFSLLSPKQVVHQLDLKHISLKRVGQFTGHLWEQLELPQYCRNSLLLNLGNTAPVVRRNQVVTIHDAGVFGWPKAYSFAFRAWYKFLLKALARTARRVITVSEFSRTELNKYCGLPSNTSRVIYLGREHIQSTMSDISILDRHNLRHKPFILAVSSLSPHKNFQAVVQAVDLIGEADFEVVIAGGANPRIFSQAGTPLSPSVKHVGYVDDAELKALYEHASGFVFPSLYEGFGLPPLEAMACGCPVIVSRSASLPEVCGDAALYCDPYSPQDIADQITALMNNAGLREEMRRKGLSRAALFSWEKCARETFKVIEELVRCGKT